jgi:oligopeptide transport system substrate-binding protein
MMPMRRFLRLTAVLLQIALLALPAMSGAAADAQRAMRVALPNAETSFDAAYASDANSDAIIANVFESMLDYDYLVRPVKLVPRTLEAIPVAEEGGRVFVCRLKRGIMFTPDAAFAGKPRELVAADYAFSLKRLLDPAVRSPWSWLLEGKLVGGEEALERAKKTGKFDYDAPFPGLEVVDRYTLRIRLKEADLRFLYALAVPNTGAMAREVVAAYGLDIGAHPVGTGPYLLGEYQRSSKIQLLANPGFRVETYVPSGPVPAGLQPIASALKGRRLPLVPRIDIAIIEEDQARWLAFLNRELDFLDIMPIQYTEQALQDGRLLPALAAKGIRHQVLLRPNVYFTYFDMENPVVGGYTPEKIALRRAISMGFNAEEQVRVLLKGRAVLADGPIPPDIAGFDPKLKTQAQRYDPAAARALLDKFGYKDTNGDGFRETPEGKPLVIERWSPPDSFYRQTDVLWKKNMDSIGIRMEIRNDKTPELRKMGRLGKIPTRSDGWNADYPDAENFMQLLYGPYAGQANDSRFNLPEFNRLYDEARRLPDSPQRTQLFDRMTELMLAYAPWRMTYSRLEDSLEHAWVRYHVPHPIRTQVWMYTDIDAALRSASK